jgi:hypothetical protein
MEGLQTTTTVLRIADHSVDPDQDLNLMLSNYIAGMLKTQL